METKIAIKPENLEVANCYLSTGSADAVAYEMDITPEQVNAILDKAEVRRYIDAVYLDRGYRNRFKLGALVDEIIESKLEECRESEVYTNKDLLDVITLAHKMRMEEIAAQNKAIHNQTNVQINEAPFGGGNYGALMEKLIGKGK